ncbi:hypothetical protein [Seohaeicola zhoushanensis]|uniref:Uncharacterized protein n=1 Tax=Seohaeicola zhoushanensis TaxID=1569283 RepID=A0A8J3GTV1_9RHOB|nr:hypothetical protein [Seohaeicola zhoushanensis]GHF33266.1 hypothetical protein GCM10017056_00850 [Seohaeicola zhoushanensis]
MAQLALERQELRAQLQAERRMLVLRALVLPEQRLADLRRERARLALERVQVHLELDRAHLARMRALAAPAHPGGRVPGSTTSSASS